MENEQKKTVKDIYTQDVLVDLLLSAKFVNELTTPEEIAIHNDRMRLIQQFIGKEPDSGDKYLRFLKTMATTIY